MKKLIYIFSVFILIIVGVKAADYFAIFKQEIPTAENISVGNIVDKNSDKLTTSTEQKYRIDKVAEGLEVPWSIVFTSPNRMLIAERPGRIRVINYGILDSKPLHTFTEVPNKSEEGLMGMALDPDYGSNKYVYVCVAYGDTKKIADKVVRLRDEGNKLVEDKILLDNIPAAQYHAGCRIAFGPDKKLYITTGEATEKEIAQDLNSLGGKILRINNDGTIPDDNPFENSSVYTYGHRNPQGIAWHPTSGVLVSTEHGPTVFDGPAGGDEINKIEKGKNYGWPLVSHDKNKEGLVASLIQFTPAVAPGSAMMYGGDMFKQWKGNLFFGGLKGEGVYMVKFTDDTANKIESYKKLDIKLGRIREVVEGLDGFIYFSTSNRDGRGKIRSGDDAIYRIVPIE